MVTLQDIAHEAGVSRVVVSCVLNDRDVRVSDETRTRIHALIERHHYQPNGLVKALRTKRTHALGVLLPGVIHSFFPRILNAMEQAASERGWQVLMCQTHSQPEILKREVDMLCERRVDGLLMTPHPDSGPLLRRLIAGGQKVVLFDDSIAGLAIPCAKSDDVLGTRLAVEHLLNLGRRRILFLGWPRDQTPNARARRRGYDEALATHGIAPDPRLVHKSPTCGIRDAFEMTRRVLADGIRFDAVFAVNDMAALGVVKAVRQAGLSIPGDVALVGYGNLRDGRFISPGLTTVEQKPEETGKRAVTLLLDDVEQNRRAEPREWLTIPELVVRGSCGGGAGKPQEDWLENGV